MLPICHIACLTQINDPGHIVCHSSFSCEPEEEEQVVSRGSGDNGVKGIRSCRDCLVAQLVDSHCSRMGQEDKQFLWRNSDLVRLRRGAIVNDKLPDAPSIITVSAGRVGSRHMLSDGRQVISTLYDPGDTIDLRGISPDANRKIVALTDASVCIHDSVAFETLIRRNAAQSAVVERNIRNQLQRSEARCLDLARKTPIERTATFLMEQYGRQVRSHTCPGSLRVLERRSDIADYLGLQSETLSRVLSRLQSEGFIRLTGRQTIELADPAGLERIAQGGRPRARSD